jgi:hypothetical protein
MEINMSATLAAVQALATSAPGGPYTVTPVTGQKAGALVAYRLVPSTTPTANLHLLHGGISLDELSAALTAGFVPADTRPSAQEANATTDQVWG